jgi:thioesterase domain-containing protein
MLAQCLGEAQPFFGLQPPGADGREDPLERVEDIAAYFADQVRDFYPQGRYIIAGYCAGGTIAFELAQQLACAGAEVRLLALFGSPFPAYFRLSSQLKLRFSQEGARIGGFARDLAARSPAAWPDYLKGRLRTRRQRLDAQEAAAQDPVLAQRARIERATLNAVRAYEPQAYRGRVALLLPSRQWQLAADWRKVAPLAREFHGPDGCGSPEMLREPYAPALAELFTRAVQPWKMP